MNCPHSLHGSSSSCSQCAGAVPRKVEQSDDVLLVDGVEARAIAGPLESYRNYRKRGRR